MRQFIKNQSGQNTAEYALLIALVVAGIIAMQTYAQRALQARVRDASKYMATATNDIGNTLQYESTHTESDYTINKETESFEQLGKGTVASAESTNRARLGKSKQAYDTAATVGNQAQAAGL